MVKSVAVWACRKYVLDEDYLEAELYAREYWLSLRAHEDKITLGAWLRAKEYNQEHLIVKTFR